MAKGQQKLPTDFKDEVVEARDTGADETPKEPAVEKTEDGTPYCVKHHCQMKQTRGTTKDSSVAYFKCPVEGCDETGKRVKTQSVIPRNPHTCPRCKEQPVLERDTKLSKPMYTILRCPVCGHKSAPMPRPEFVSGHNAARSVASVEALGSR